MFVSLVMTPSSKASQPTLLKSFPPVLLRTNDQPYSLNLTNYFKVDPATNMVRVTTSLANSNGIPLGFTLQLLSSNAPKTVANFLAYVNDGAYENTLIHRSVPGFVIQAGGYTDEGTGSGWNTPIETWTNVVPSEYGVPNSRGTVAMALVGSDSNSATSQWFINLNNNASVLDVTNTSGNPPFTVFARVIGNGMQVVDAIAALKTCSSIATSTNPPYPLIDLSWLLYGEFSTMPLNGITTNSTSLQLSNLVTFTRVATIPYFALSSDSTAYAPRISNSTLFIDYTGGTNPPSKPVTISVIATDTNGLTTNTSFQVWHLTNQVRTINYPTISNQPYTTNPFFLPYWPSTSDDTPLSANNISFSGPLRFAGDGQAYYTGTGTLTFTYVQPSNLFYRGVTNTSSFVISKAQQTITFPTLSNPVVFSTNPFTLTNLPVSSSRLPVTLSIAPNSPARWRVTNSQLLFTGVGTVTLVANQSGNSNYLAASPVTNTLVVSKGPQTITFPPVNNQILTQRNPSPLVPLKAIATSALPVQYRVISASNNVTPKGFITNNSFLQVTGIGTVTVEAFIAESSNYLAAAPVTNTVTSKYAQTLRAFERIPSRTFTNPYASFRVRVPTTDSVASTSTNVIVTATPINIATITSNSIVTIKGAGTVTLTATQAGDEFYFPASVSTSFTVAKAPQIIAPLVVISPRTNGIASFPIPVPAASSGLPVNISASGAGYASRNGTNVMITLTNAGSVTVTARQTGDGNYLPANTVSRTFSVAKGNQSINFPAIGTNHVFGDIFQLQATATPSGLPVSYKITSGTNAARLINANSVYISAPVGRVTIVASQDGSSGYNAAAPKTNSFTIARPPTP
jgi:cyclophilin family peptidyl-prolyl cis-trans isomerase